MATILICVPHLPAAMNHAFGLARSLCARGHDVRFVGVRDCEAYARANRFPFQPFLATWAPKGYADSYTQVPSSAPLRRFLALRRNSQREGELLRVLVEHGRREFRELAMNLHADICLIVNGYLESTIWALLAHHAQLRAVYLNDMFVQPPHPGVPPVSSGLIPRRGLLGRAQVALAWSRRSFRGRVDDTIHRTLGIAYCWRKGFTTLAAACRYPLEQIEFRDIVSPKLPLPELVLWPRVFDFPHAARAGMHYVEPAIDMLRTQAPFPWERVDGEKPLIYCTVGTQPAFMSGRRYRAFFASVLRAAMCRRDWQWVISTGDAVGCAELGPPPSNVIVVRRAPQLEILKRAHIAITHGGAKTIKEAVYFGVPMIVLPMGFDQPGMAARVRFHGLGLVGNGRRISSARLLTLLQRLDATPSFRARVRHMSRQFREAEERQPGVRLIETLIPAARACEMSLSL